MDQSPLQVKRTLRSKTKPMKGGAYQKQKTGFVDDKNLIVGSSQIRDDQKVRTTSQVVAIRDVRQTKRYKRTIQKIKKKQLQTHAQFVAWFANLLPEGTRDRIALAISLGVKENSNDIYKDKVKKRSLDNEEERFYRKVAQNSIEIATLGNARPQHTVYKNLEDEELGSLLQFRVPRRCRQHSQETKNSDGRSRSRNAHFDSTNQLLSQSPSRAHFDSQSIAAHSSALGLGEEPTEADWQEMRKSIAKKQRLQRKMTTVIGFEKKSTFSQETKKRSAMYGVLRRRQSERLKVVDPFIQDFGDKMPTLSPEQVEQLF